MAMNPLTRTRSESFPIVGNSKDGPPFKWNFILVHGLRSSDDDEFNHETSLESWVKGVAGDQGGSYQVRPFRFRSPEMLSDGMASFNRARFALLSKLHKVRSEFEFVDVELQAGPEGQPEAPPPSMRPVFIFITHGLGSWLVKDILSSPDGNSVAIDTFGLIFLDVHDIHNGSLPSFGTGDYEHTISQLHRRFSREPASKDVTAKISTLAAEFQKVDARFKKARMGLARQLGQEEALRTIFLTVWSRDSTEITKQLTREARAPTFISAFILPVRRLFRRRSKIPNQTALSTEVENFLKETERLAHRNPPGEFPEPLEPGGGQPATDPAQHRTSLQSLSTIESAYRNRLSVPGTTATVNQNQELAIAGNNRGNLVYQRDWDVAEKEARSFLQRGQLRNARIAFEDALEDLKTKPDEPRLNLAKIKIKMRIAVISLLNGNAAEAEEGLNHLLAQNSSKELDLEGWDRVTREARRWLAVSLISQGKYSDAVRKLEGLVGENPDAPAADMASFKAKRDLAVAYGLQGTIRKAERTIQSLKGSDLARSDRRRNSTISLATEYLGFDAKTETLEVAAAVIDTLWGNYDAALDGVTGALGELKKHLGVRHIKTLQTARFRAFLLALTGQTMEAEEECMQTLQVMSRELGSKHPSTLETTGILVYVFRTRRRLIEAIDTAETLCKDAEEVLSEGNPLTLRLKAEQARCHRSEGNYATSRKILKAVLDSLEISQDGNDGLYTLEGLRYEAELAYVDYRIGNLEESQRRSISALKKQRELFGTRRIRRVGKSAAAEAENPREAQVDETDSAFVDQLLDDMEYELELERRTHPELSQTPPLSHKLPNLESKALQDRANDIDRSVDQYLREHGLQVQKLPQAGGKHPWRREPDNRLRELFIIRVHPLILYTLRVLALVLSQLENPDVERVCRMLNLVWHWQSKPNSLGRKHPVSLMTEYDYAMTLREFGEHAIARDRFENVFITRTEVLGASHPDTVAARRELVITMCLVNVWKHPDSYLSPWKQAETDTSTAEEDTSQLQVSTGSLPDGDGHGSNEMDVRDWDEVEICSRAIFKLHQARLGKRHPETLKSLTWIFTLQLLLGKVESADQTCSLLLGTLQSEFVVSERFLDTVQIEGRIARLYLELSQSGRGDEILSHLAGRKSDLPGFRALQERIVGSLRRLSANKHAEHDGSDRNIPAKNNGAETSQLGSRP